nr:protein FAM219B isoform X3 [Zootoca vivipara]
MMEAAAAGGGAEPPGRREATTLPGPSRDTGQRDKKRTSRETPVEKRGPYLMSKTPSIQDKLQKHREMAKAMLRRKGGAFSGAVRHQPKLPAKSDEELGSRCSSGYSSAEVNQDLSRQLLQDGYRLDEIPDDEDLDLIPPKPVSSSPCPCYFGESASCSIQ